MKRFIYFGCLVIVHSLWATLRDIVLYPIGCFSRALGKLRKRIMERAKPIIQKDPETGEEKVLLDGRLYTPSEVFEAYHLALDIKMRAMRSRKPRN